MELTLLAKEDKSGKDGCKSVYLAGPGLLAFQGPTVDPADMRNVLAGEAGVYVELEIVRAALEALDQM